MNMLYKMLYSGIIDVIRIDHINSTGYYMALGGALRVDNPIAALPRAQAELCQF